MTIDEFRKKLEELDEEYKHADYETKKFLHDIASKYEFIYNLLANIGIEQEKIMHILDSYYSEIISTLRGGKMHE